MYQRRGTKQQWESTNPVLAVGEIGFSFNENVIKLGDGLTAWNSLPSVNGNSAYQVAKANGYIGTETQWLASLVGPAGATGATGPAGPAGADGATGPAGPEGGFFSTQTISTISSSTYTLQASDVGKLFLVSVACTITVPNVLSIGQQVDFNQYGTGQITFATSGGATIGSRNGYLKTASQFSPATLKKVDSDTGYVLIGDLGV